MNETSLPMLQALQQDIAGLDRISMNLANALTPGYKRSLAGPGGSSAAAGGDFSHVLARLGLQRSSQLPQTASPASTTAMSADSADTAPPTPSASSDVSIDFTQGTLKPTGEPLDLALNGKGFFEVATATGPAYTRQGNFSLDARGRLVTAAGDPVMGTAGEIILERRQVVIDGNGNVFDTPGPQGALAPAPGLPGARQPARQPLAQLRIVEFDHPRQLLRAGAGLLAPPSGASIVAAPVADGTVEVRQAHLENSNVDTLHEMVQLMQSMRHAESMTRVIQSHDDMLGNAIRKLGENA